MIFVMTLLEDIIISVVKKQGMENFVKKKCIEENGIITDIF